MVRTAAELVAARDADPFVRRGDDTGSVHLTFFAGAAPDPGDLSAYAPDTAVPVGGELHLFLPNGLGRSKLAADLDRKLAARRHHPQLADGHRPDRDGDRRALTRSVHPIPLVRVARPRTRDAGW